MAWIPPVPHQLYMDFDGAGGALRNLEADGVPPFVASPYGPNFKIVDTVALGISGMPSGWRYMGRYRLGPNDQPTTPGRWYVAHHGVDPLIVANGEPGAITPYYQGIAWQFNGNDLYFISPHVIFDHAVDPQDPSVGSKAVSDGSLPMAKIGEWGHTDQYIDGQFTGWHGHNNIGIQLTQNRADLVGPGHTFPNGLFTVAGKTYQLSQGASQSTDPKQPLFVPAVTDRQMYYTFAVGSIGNVTTSDNTGGWALMPVQFNRIAWFVFRWKMQDFDGSLDLTPGSYQLWASYDPTNEWTTSTPPLIDWSGPTNDWAVDTASGSVKANFDPNTPRSIPNTRPWAGMKRPQFRLPTMMYVTTNAPGTELIVYNGGMRSELTFADVLKHVQISTPVQNFFGTKGRKFRSSRIKTSLVG